MNKQRRDRFDADLAIAAEYLRCRELRRKGRFGNSRASDAFLELERRGEADRRKRPQPWKPGDLPPL